MGAAWSSIAHLTEALTTCRICAGKCSLRLTLDDAGRIVAVRGDRTDPLTRGYACFKGLQLHEAHYSPDRLHHPLKRTPGGFEQIPLDRALDEIAQRIGALMADSGPGAIGAFKGTMNYTNFLANAMLPAFVRALGSPAFYSTMTIDQSAKWVTFERLGGWHAGKQAFDTADVVLLVGANPLVSLATFNVPLQDPARQLRAAKARGLKLVVIDPRLTETAHHADVHLRPWPGEDPAVLAGLLHIILVNNWHDAAFCEDYAAGLAALRNAVAPFMPAYVAARAGVAEADLAAAASAFAEPFPDGRGKRGSAASGVGPNMAAHSNLAEHLLEALNVVCGRFARAGEKVPNPGVLGARWPRHAVVVPPQRTWESPDGRGPGGYGLLFGERMTGALADDILTDMPGRLRALIVDGGNPVSALPDTRAAAQALRALDLLVVIDPFLTPTARLAHYVIPPRMMLERADVGSRDYESIITFKPYGRYDAPVIDPPLGSEAVDDWVVLWELARRLNLPLELDGVAQDVRARPSSEALITSLLKNSAVPFDELSRSPEGRIFEVEPMYVQAAAPGPRARFELAPADILEELGRVRAELGSRAGGGYRFAVRRLRDVQNTMYHHLPPVAARIPTNLAFMHPDDLAVLGLAEGDSAAISSEHGCIVAPVRADTTQRRGVISMAHGWGGLPGEVGTEAGVNTNLLTSGCVGRDPINAMPILTGFTVRIERVGSLGPSPAIGVESMAV
jgi:anaerobic selenocysteine-containing dehydrogenase